MYYTFFKRTWPILGRSPNLECQSKLMENFCSFIYNDRGLCVPPHLLSNKKSHREKNSSSMFDDIIFNKNSYPERGHRPQKLKDTLRDIKKYKR